MAARTIEERLRALEDLEELRTLMALYARYWDAGIDPDAGDEAQRAERFSQLFTPDGVWEVPKLGLRYAGHAELRDFVWRIQRDHHLDATGQERDFPGLAIHLAVNPDIHLDGDEATGWWTGFVMGSIAAEEQSIWYGFKYKVQCRRTEVGWRFVNIAAEASFMTAFDGPGWVRQRFVPPRELASPTSS